VPLEILTAAIAASEGAQGSLITYMEGHFKADLQILGYIADAVEDGNLQVPFKYATEGGRERYVAELRDEIAGLQQTWDASKAEGDVISLMVIAAATKLERRRCRPARRACSHRSRSSLRPSGPRRAATERESLPSCGSPPLSGSQSSWTIDG